MQHTIPRGLWPPELACGPQVRLPQAMRCDSPQPSRRGGAFDAAPYGAIRFRIDFFEKKRHAEQKLLKSKFTLEASSSQPLPRPAGACWGNPRASPDELASKRRSQARCAESQEASPPSRRAPAESAEDGRPQTTAPPLDRWLARNSSFRTTGAAASVVEL